MGFDDYLSKPIELPKLEELLIKYLPKNEYTIENKEDVNGKNDNNMISGVASDTQKCIIKKLNDNGLNTEAGLSYSSDDIEFYFEILRGFVKEYSEKSRVIKSILGYSFRGEHLEKKLGDVLASLDDFETDKAGELLNDIIAGL